MGRTRFTKEALKHFKPFHKKQRQLAVETFDHSLPVLEEPKSKSMG
jgi:hypothetical protein